MSKLSERDICTKFITPALVSAGWDLHTQIREEVSFTKGRIIVRGKLHSRGKGKRADYTSGVFTSDAEAFAKGRNIELIDGSVLTGMIEGAKSARPVGMPAAPVAASGASPACPKCGSAMVRRTARQGAKAGAAFWGCSTFPKCRGVRAIE